MESDQDWYFVLDSVLSACRIATHCSTGVSPYRMVFNKDPILPFEYKDKLNYHPDRYLQDDVELKGTNIGDNSNDAKNTHEFSHTLEEMEKQKYEIFGQAKDKFKKSTKTSGQVLQCQKSWCSI